jgi:hypothetical protein
VDREDDRAELAAVGAGGQWLSEECEMSEWREAAAAGVVKKAVGAGERERVLCVCSIVSCVSVGQY